MGFEALDMFRKNPLSAFMPITPYGQCKAAYFLDFVRNMPVLARNVSPSSREGISRLPFPSPARRLNYLAFWSF